ncbi:insulinase family protein [Polluticaenibacter yanchengensis]|uniref:Insulinase family protein n=1 Tax=Polluticaenibacter yanchengensis TaxID=3014562 RepID=A0ABT4UFP5_9BACT|nr:insulinase family protein [Chitinophagaceae bacterium LY-5]
MKYIFSTILLATAFSVNAQIDRTKAPKPLAAKEIKIPEAQKFKMPNGIEIIVVRNTKLPQVSATFTIDKLAIDEGSKAGLADLAGQLIRYGNAKMDKATLDEEVDFLGGSFSTGALSASVSSLKSNFPKVFGIMTNVVLNPAFKETDLDKLKKQALSGLQSSKDDPSAISKKVNAVLMYGKKHPFGQIETEESINSITINDVKDFYNKNWAPNNSYLVFVGDITLAEAKALAIKSFGSWKPKTIATPSLPVVKPLTGNFIAVVDRPNSVQSVITVSKTFDLQPNSKDALAASLMNTVLGGGFSSHLNQNLREKHGFTYGAGSSLNTSRVKGSFSASAQVRNEKTDSALVEMLKEIEAMYTKAQPDTALTNIKNYVSGGFSRSLEQPATIARFALNTAINKLPADYYNNYIKNLYAISSTDIKDVARKYLGTPALITIVGKASDIAKSLELIGPVKYFDFYGNEVAAPKTAAIDPSVTPSVLLEKALKSYGDYQSVKDVTYKGKMNMMGQAFDFDQKVLKNDAYQMKVSMGPMVLFEQSKVGDVYAFKQQGNDMPIDEGTKAELKSQTNIFSELTFYNNPDYQATVTGIEKVNGKEAYVVKFTDVKTNKFEELYFDKADGYVVKSSKLQEGGPAGSVKVDTYYSDFKTYGGVKFATKTVVDMGQMKQEVVLSEIKVNSGLTKESFK